MALRLAVDMNLFDAATEAVANQSGVSIEQLAPRTSADPLLVSKCKVRKILVDLSSNNE